jgi:hypothetical protein
MAARVPVVVPEHSMVSLYWAPVHFSIGPMVSQCLVVWDLCSSYTCSPSMPGDPGPNGSS